MAGQKGRDLVLKIADYGAFATIAGLRATSIKFNAKPIDGTSAESTEAWRELIPGAGVKSAAIEGEGVFKDARSDALLREAFFTQSATALQIVAPDFGLLEGLFLVERLEYGGAYDGEATFSIALASAGLLNFSAL